MAAVCTGLTTIVCALAASQLGCCLVERCNDGLYAVLSCAVLRVEFAVVALLVWVVYTW